MALSKKQIHFLKGLAHSARPVVIVGDKGLSDAVLKEIDGALAHHEFIKVRIRADREQRRKWIDEIGEKCQAERISAIGQVACFFRRNPDQPVVRLPDSG